MRRQHSIFLTVLVISCIIMPMIATAKATTVWSDNFNDKNTDGWSIYGFNRTANPITSLPGNFSAGDGTLRAYDDEFNVAQHGSTQAYGTWEFDIDLVQTPANHCLVAFISGDEPIPDAPYEELSVDPSYSYGMIFATGEFGSEDTSFTLYRRNSGSLSTISLGSYDPDSWHEGWYHIEITRDLAGNFKVYINSTLRIEATNNAFTESEVFYIHGEAGIAIDNIVVTDEAPTTQSTPTTTGTSNGNPQFPDTTLLLIAGGIIAVVVVIIIIMKMKS